MSHFIVTTGCVRPAGWEVFIDAGAEEAARRKEVNEREAREHKRPDQRRPRNQHAGSRRAVDQWKACKAWVDENLNMAVRMGLGRWLADRACARAILDACAQCGAGSAPFVREQGSKRGTRTLA